MSATTPTDGGSSTTPDDGDRTGAPADPSELSDCELVEALRAGDRSATGELFRRHHEAASRVARQLVRSRSDADDVVSDAFTRVFKAIDNGRGPTDNFRGYLYTAIRSSACRRHSEAKRLVLSSQHQHLVDFEASADPVVETFDRTAAGRAYGSLPERWQTVLWLVDVEDRPASEVAQILGMTPNAVAALSYRAREGLRQGFLTAHTGEGHQPDAACEPIRPLLSPYVRARTSARDTLRVERHVEHCDDCTALIEELRNVNQTIVHGIAPLLVPVAAIAALRAAPGWGSAAAPVGAAAAAAGGAAKVTASVAAKSAPKFALPFHLPAAVVGGVGAVATAAAVAAVVLLGPSTPAPDEAAAPRETSTTVERSKVEAQPASQSAPAAPDSEVESATATTTPPTEDAAAPVRPTPTTTVAPDRPRDVAPTAQVPVAPPATPAGELTVSQVGPLSAGGIGHVVVEAADLQTTGRLLHLSWVAPDGFEVRSARSEAGRCDATGCDLDPGSGSTTVALTIAAASGPSTPGSFESGPAAPTSSAADGRVAAAGTELELLLADPASSFAPVAARLPLSTSESHFTTRFAGVGHLGLAATGNSVLTCVSGVACGEARAGLGTKRSNDLWDMTLVDTDGDPATRSSSSAVLELPAGATVVHAELIWGGQLLDGSGGDPSTVRLDLGGHRVVAADTVFHGEDGAYQSVADITTTVAAAANGTVTIGVADVATTPRRGAWGGWSVAVVVEHPQLPRRAAVLAVGLDQGDTVLPLLPGGTGRVDELLAIQWDGDPDLVPDGIDVVGAGSVPLRLVDPTNPAGDLANSSVSVRGGRVGGTDPNTFGIDVDLVGVQDGIRRDPALSTVAGAERRIVGLLGATIALG